MSDENITASEAAMKCGTMSGARLASVATAKDINLIKSATNLTLGFWIGTYRNENSGNKIVLSDGRRQIEEELTESIFATNSFNRSICPTCNCGYVNDNEIQFLECQQNHQYICEYKGGPSCPKHMYSLYGKCLGFVRNVGGSGQPVDSDCYFHSGSKHNYRLANVLDIEVSILGFFTLP